MSIQTSSRTCFLFKLDKVYFPFQYNSVLRYRCYYRVAVCTKERNVVASNAFKRSIFLFLNK